MYMLAQAVLGILVFPMIVYAGEGTFVQSTDAVSKLIVAGVTVWLFYALFRENRHRTHNAMIAAAVLLGATYLTPYKLLSLTTAIHVSIGLEGMNVEILLMSMMMIIGAISTTNVFPWLMEHILERSNNVPRSLFYGTSEPSMGLDNVTTVLFTGPIARFAAKMIGVRAASLMMPQIVASNIGGTATLIGDPPNILIGSKMHLGFMDFIWALFIPVHVMLIAVERFTAWYFRSDYEQIRPVEIPERTQLKNVPFLLWSLAVLALVFVGFATHHLTGMETSIPALLGAVAIVTLQEHYYVLDVRHGRTEEEREHRFFHVFTREVDWLTLFFFFFLFMVIGASVAVGNVGLLAECMSLFIQAASGWLGLSETGTLIVAALTILIVSAVASGVLDNIPFTLLAIPIVQIISKSLGDETHALTWALAFGACLGGNLTPIGASANVVIFGMFAKNEVSFGEYIRYGAPATAITIGIAATYLVSYIALGQWMTLAATTLVLGVLFGVCYILPARKARAVLAS